MPDTTSTCLATPAQPRHRLARDARDKNPAKVRWLDEVAQESATLSLTRQLTMLSQQVRKNTDALAGVEKALSDLAIAFARFQGIVGLVAPQTVELSARRPLRPTCTNTPAFLLPPDLTEERGEE